MNDDLWIFGYGSLVWRPDFSYVDRWPAFIEGWARRFWQGSTDHRGVPGAPGRVVTLVAEPGAVCRGMAYRVEASAADAVLALLDYREKGGYRLERLPFSLAAEGGTAGMYALVYIAMPDNPNYLGPAPDATIARQVRAARGPSGSNVDYVLRLAEALREIGAEDGHVFDIEDLLRQPDSD